MTRFDFNQVRQQVESLMRDFPELVEDEILRADTIEGQTDFYEFMRSLERDRQKALELIEGINAIMEERIERKHRFQRREQALRRFMFHLLQTADLRKLELPEATVSLQRGPVSVIINNEDAIPDEFCRIRREPDRIKIRLRLADGNEVSGAILSNAADVLVIRTK